MKNKYYIYRFLDKNDNLLYIGRTKDIERRILKEHFTALGHLPKECYKSVEYIEFAAIENESEEVAYEAILINQLKPKYNKQFKDDGLFDVSLPRFEWNKFKFSYEGELKYLKSRKDDTQDINSCIFDRFNKVIDDNDALYTGFVTFDERSPIYNTDLILLAGPTNSLKTTYALNVCNYISNHLNKKVLYVNLKNDTELLTDKIISMETMTPLKDIRNNFNSCKEKKEMLISHMPMKNIEFTNLTYKDKNIDNIIKIIESKSYDFIVIDDLQSIVSQKDIYIKDKTLEIMQKLKSLTLSIRVPILLISNILSSKVTQRTDGRAMISDLEYESLQLLPDKIKFLYTYNTYYPELSEEKDLENMIEVIVSKNNIDGPYTFNNLLFINSYSKIINMELNKDKEV